MCLSPAFSNRKQDNRKQDNHGARKLNSGWKKKILSITQQAICRGTFRSVKGLVEKIDQYVQTSNNHAQPFLWTATASAQ